MAASLLRVLSERHEIPFKQHADLLCVDDLHLEFEMGLAGALESRLERCQRGIIRPHANGTEHSAHRASVADVALADYDVRIAVPKLQPEHGIAGQGGQCTEAAAEGGAKMIVVWLQRCRHYKLCAVVAFHFCTHGLRERYLLMQEAFGITQKVVVHGNKAVGVSFHFAHQLDRQALGVSGLINVSSE